MSYTIIRVAKITNVGKMVATLDHNHRSRPCPGASADMIEYNETLVGEDTPTDMQTHRNLLEPLTRQKNSVLALEYVIACPPEAIEALDGPRDAPDGKYLKNAAKWVSERHGGPHTVVSAVIHRDEDSPHLHIVVVPITKAKRRGGHEHQILSAKHYVGGREKLRALQTEFTRDVGANFGLERGIPKELTRRVHRAVGTWERPREIATRASQLTNLSPDDLAAIVVSQQLQAPSLTHSLVAAQVRRMMQEQEGWKLDPKSLDGTEPSTRNLLASEIEYRTAKIMNGHPKILRRTVDESLRRATEMTQEELERIGPQVDREIEQITKARKVEAPATMTDSPVREEPEERTGRRR